MPRKKATTKATETRSDDGDANVEINLEEALGDLETLVEELERGDLPLADALERFERGVALTRNCETALKAAEHKVSLLMADAGIDDEPEPFGDPDD